MSGNVSRSIPVSYAENTAFTSLLVGVFLNSPMITSKDIRSLRELNVEQQYGRSFQYSLNLFSQRRPIEQIHLLHQIQR